MISWYLVYLQFDVSQKIIGQVVFVKTSEYNKKNKYKIDSSLLSALRPVSHSVEILVPVVELFSLEILDCDEELSDNEDADIKIE